MRNNIEGVRIDDSILGKGMKMLTLTQTLTGTFTMDADMPQALFLDPGGAGRTVLLPPETRGLYYRIFNTADAAEDLTVKDDANAVTYAVINAGGVVDFYSDGTIWYVFAAGGSVGQAGGTAGLAQIPAHTFVNTAGAGTYTAAALVAGRILRDCAGASRTDTTATAAALVAALPGVRVGDGIRCYVANVSDPLTEVITIAGGTGVTISTDIQTAALVIAGADARTLEFRFTNVTPASEAATLTF